MQPMNDERHQCRPKNINNTGLMCCFLMHCFLDLMQYARDLDRSARLRNAVDANNYATSSLGVRYSYPHFSRH